MSATSWHQIVRHRDGIGWIQEPVVKSFLVEGDERVAVIDTGMGVGDFAALVRAFSDRAPVVLQTHAHWDHVGGSHAFREVLVHPAEADMLRAGWPAQLLKPSIERFAGDYPLPPSHDPETASIPGVEPAGWLHDGDRIDLGGRVLEVIATPGHSAGGVSLLDRQARALFTGDAVSLDMALVCLPDSDPVAYRASLRRLAELADEVDEVFVCHGGRVDGQFLKQLHDAYEAVWSGDVSGRDDVFDLGTLQCPCEVYEVNGITFLVTPDRVL